ncbi:MAG TPA: NUDIX domain-containing protein [Pyrinomonadaceae bacterium]|jgi:hypothetical protein|nr:NUDIX domain-containing protein [Pyrinomonadaceae bacterium]
MSFEPQKIFIGLVDFFSVWLPGALLVYLVKDGLGPRILATYKSLPETEGWIIFLFGSYLLGHFIFLIGSFLLDDVIYDRLRGATVSSQIRVLANGKCPARPLTRWLAGFFMSKTGALYHALWLKERQFEKSFISGNELNTFQWSKAKLTLKHPDAMESIHRFEADSKFFRSLVIVCLMVFGLLAIDLIRQIFSFDRLFENAGPFAVAAIFVAPLAFWRYVEQRLKATNQAYIYIVTLEGGCVKSEPRADGLTHAGGVVWRQAKNGFEYLLVQASKKPNEWVLPKGHIEMIENTRETAVREVYEETGIWARVDEGKDQKPDNVIFPKESDAPAEEKDSHVCFYRMKAATDRWDDKIALKLSGIRFRIKDYFGRNDPCFKPRRKHKWVSLGEAENHLKENLESLGVLKKIGILHSKKTGEQEKLGDAASS